jgi:hypothetical protein
MKIGEALIVFGLVVNALLVIVYTGTLAAICRGVRHRKVFLMTVLLLMSNFAGCWMPVLEFELNTA